MYQIERRKMASGFGHVNTNSPDSLFSLSLKLLTSNLLDVLCKKTRKGYVLRENVAVPNVFWKLIIEVYQKKGNDINDYFANMFKNDSKNKLKSLNLRNCSISGNSLKYFLRHNLYELTLIDCHSLSYGIFNEIFNYANNLEMLNIDTGSITTKYSESHSRQLYRLLQNINLKAPNLKHLVLRKLVIWPYFFLDNIKLNDEFRVLMKKLEILDLSYGLGIDCFFYHMCNPTNLHTLILFDARHLVENDTILHICTLKTLVVLDISQSDYSSSRGLFKNENSTLKHIVKSLPKLMSLDISGTNLAGNGISRNPAYVSLNGTHEILSDIPGLRTRANKPFKFLGLYHTMYDACQRQNIPAKTISGDANEGQLLIAAEFYMDRPSQIKNILDDIKYLVKGLQLAKIDKVLDIVLEVLTRYTNEKSIQMLCISTINDIVVLYKNSLILNNINVQNKIISALLMGINFHNYNIDMIRQGCLTISLFARIPLDQMYEFRRLLYSQGFSQKFIMIFLNAVTLNLNNDQKNELGNFGVIMQMMAIIENKLKQEMYDDVLEVAWSIMLNIMDEVPTNCKRFLDRNGIGLFFGCLKTFPNKYQLIRVMMSLLVKVAEVKETRPWLMQNHIIDTLYDFLYYTRERDEYELSIYAAGVFAYLVSDDKNAWPVNNVLRGIVLERITEAIQNWSLDAHRKMCLISVKPILKLAQVRHTPQCFQYALWVLANLTVMYSEDFCPMVIAEGGLQIIQDLLDDNDSMTNQPSIIWRLAQIIINQCLIYNI